MNYNASMFSKDGHIIVIDKAHSEVQVFLKLLCSANVMNVE